MQLTFEQFLGRMQQVRAVRGFVIGGNVPNAKATAQDTPEEWAEKAAAGQVPALESSKPKTAMDAEAEAQERKRKQDELLAALGISRPRRATK